MAYAVMIGSGYSKMSVRFPTPEQALAEAQDRVDHDEKDITIRIAATGEEFTVDDFRARLSAKSPT